MLWESTIQYKKNNFSKIEAEARHVDQPLSKMHYRVPYLLRQQRSHASTHLIPGKTNPTDYNPRILQWQEEGMWNKTLRPKRSKSCGD